MKHTFKLTHLAAVGACAAGLYSPIAQAQGIPVYDNASFINSIQQVVAWGQQSTQMIQQYNQLVAQVQQIQNMATKLNGARGLGSILNDPNILSALPPELQDSANLFSDAVLNAGALNNINTLKASFGIPATVGAIPITAGNSAANTLGKLQQILAASQLRAQQVAAIGLRVDTSVDAKASMDLAARAVNEGNRAVIDLTQTVVSIEAERNATKLRELAEDQAVFTDIRSRRAAEKATRGY